MSPLPLFLWTTACFAVLAALPALLAPRGKRLHVLLLLTIIAALGAVGAVLPAVAANGAAGGLFLLWFVAALILTIQGTRRHLLERRARNAGWLPAKQHQL